MNFLPKLLPSMSTLIPYVLNMIPMGKYRTIILSVLLIVVMAVVGFTTGEWSGPAGVIGLALTNIFQRAGTQSAQNSVEELNTMIADALARLFHERNIITNAETGVPELTPVEVGLAPMSEETIATGAALFARSPNSPAEEETHA